VDNYKVTFVFDYCTIVATCNADHKESAPDLAWDWVTESTGISSPLSAMRVIDVIVEYNEDCEA